jgi:hypothetical protein
VFHGEVRKVYCVPLEPFFLDLPLSILHGIRMQSRKSALDRLSLWGSGWAETVAEKSVPNSNNNGLA